MHVFDSSTTRIKLGVNVKHNCNRSKLRRIKVKLHLCWTCFFTWVSAKIDKLETFIRIHTNYLLNNLDISKPYTFFHWISRMCLIRIYFQLNESLKHLRYTVWKHVGYWNWHPRQNLYISNEFYFTVSCKRIWLVCASINEGKYFIINKSINIKFQWFNDFCKR